MEHIAALLLLVGCSDNLEQCREIPAPEPIFETMQACDEVLPVTFEAPKHSSPKVFAKCVYVDPAMHEEDAELVWEVTSSAGLEAEVIAGNSTVASLAGSEATKR